MDEFDAELERRLREAHRQARTQGRNDVGDYILLRATNDKLRADGVTWLVETFVGLAAEANRAGAGLSLERSSSSNDSSGGAHRFQVGNSTMVGTRLVLRAGVRALTVEAGWPRTPGDGIVRGGGLGYARVSHFGDRAAGEEFLLVQGEAGAPTWFVLETSGARTELAADRLQRHVERLRDVK